MVLMQMANMLFGPQSPPKIAGLAKLLEKVLDTELAPHSLAGHQEFAPGGVEVPLLVCHGAYDVIVDAQAHSRWQPYLKTGDRLWTCPANRHFFHNTHAPQTSTVILDFWQYTDAPLVRTPLIEILS